MYDVFEDQENVYIVMESIENGSLVKLLEDKCGKTGFGLPEDFVQFYVAQAFLALNHLHSKGYTHNDSHNDNFLLDTQGFLKLIDLGLAFKFGDFKDPVKKNAYIGKENSMPFRGWNMDKVLIIGLWAFWRTGLHLARTPSSTSLRKKTKQRKKKQRGGKRKKKLLLKEK
ncbi:protein kinase domain-containing protein [Ditylenchus destructor]|nr:protein kinase domain-containing protein [Ditylenchus destructor]